MGDGKSDLLLAVEGLPTIGRVIAHIMTWISHAWQSFASLLSDILQNPGEWCLFVARSSYDSLHRHPQIVCFTSLCLFLGPMVLLIPFILFHEMAILFLFNLGFITHGLTPGRLEDQYDAVKERFVESREMVFASVDGATATFNQWTTDHFLLRFLRVGAGVLGTWTLVNLWIGWTETQS